MALTRFCLASLPSACEAIESLTVAKVTAVSRRPNPLQYIIDNLPSESKPGLPVRERERKHIVLIADIKSYTVSGQNIIGKYITPMVLIQPTDVEQNAVNNDWLLKLQPGVI